MTTDTAEQILAAYRDEIAGLRAEVERLRDVIVKATHTQMQDEIHAILARREKEGK